MTNKERDYEHMKADIEQVLFHHAKSNNDKKMEIFAILDSNFLTTFDMATEGTLDLTKISFSDFVNVYYKIKGFKRNKVHDQIIAYSEGIVKQVIVVTQPRQSGTSTLMCLYALWYCYRNPDQFIIYMSNSMTAVENSRRLILEIHKTLQGMDIRKYNANEVVFNNDSGILFASGQSAVWRLHGQSIAVLIMDNIDSKGTNKQEIFHTVMPCMVAHKDWRIIDIQTYETEEQLKKMGV